MGRHTISLLFACGLSGLVLSGILGGLGLPGFPLGKVYGEGSTAIALRTTPQLTMPQKASVTASVSYQNYMGRKYLLGPNDVISISVFDSPEFDQEEIRIQPDGNIVVAPLGNIKVAGLTLDELREKLVEKYKYYLNHPQVTIKLDKTKPFTVYVSGGVVNPGSYEFVTDSLRNQPVFDNTPEVSIERKSPLLSNILVAAGGLSFDSDLEHVQIVNRFDNTKMEVNVLELIQDSRNAQDIYLVWGDSVHVPRLPTSYAVSDERFKAIAGSTVFQKTIPIKIYGYVNRPGLVKLDAAQSANLNSAIVAAGGYLNTHPTHNAPYAPKHIFISRDDGHGRLTTTKVDPKHFDKVLMPNDIVYVPDKMRPKVGRAFDYLARLIRPAASAASAYNSWALMFDPQRFQVNVSN